MIPGPVAIPDDILKVYYTQPVAHYGKEWAVFYIETEKKLTEFLGTGGRSYLIPGSGSLGIETASSTFLTSKKCLVLKNGFFGERIFRIVSKYTTHAEMMEFSNKTSIDPQEVRLRIKDKQYDAVFMVYVETSTGVLNPVEEVAAAAKEYGVFFFLDAISSAGIEDIDMDGWGIDVVVSASQKGFECPAGLTMITVNRKMLENLKNSPPTTWYTDLRVWNEYYQEWNAWHPFPVTLPTNVIRALSKSLEIIVSEGVGTRMKMYADVSSRFRRAVAALGLELFAPRDRHAHGLTSVSSGEKFAPSDLIEFLKNSHGIQIAGSLGELGKSLFRVAHMSRKQCESQNLVGVITGIADFLQKKKIKVPVEKAIKELEN